VYFGNYKKLIYLAQVEDPLRVEDGRQAASRLGLAYEYRVTGYGELASSLSRASLVVQQSVVSWQN